jgi:dTDP-4-amino-4,6-dideoxygalactose transaminase
MTSSNKPITFSAPCAAGPELDYVAQVLRSTKWGGEGPFSQRCQRLIENALNVKHALLTHSGSAALEMAAIIAGLQPNDEVIMPSFTFSSTANAVVLRGAVPVFVDIRADTLNIDEKNVESAITPRTKAVMAVHYAGVCCAMDEINAVARRRNLLVIEDAAHAYLATYRGRAAGALGDMGAISFHESKNIVCGEGGAFVTPRSDLAQAAEIVREKGTDRSKFLRGEIDKYSWVGVGSSFLASEIVAAVLLAQLEAAQSITARRIAIWKRYHARFEKLEAEGRLRRPIVPSECEHNGHLYYLLLETADKRDAVIEALRKQSISTPFHYVPLHQSPAGAQFGRMSGELTVTGDSAARLIRMPLRSNLTDEEVDRVADAIDAALRPGDRRPLTYSPDAAPPPSFEVEKEQISARGAHGLAPLMFGKRSLVAKLGVAAGFTKYKEFFGLPEAVAINYRSLEGQCAFAKRHGMSFVETAEGGKPFRIRPMKIIGEGTCSEFKGLSRATCVASVEGAYVRGRSAVIEVGRHALLDFEDQELDLFDFDCDIDPAIFHDDRHGAWVISAKSDDNCLHFPEAFTLLGPHCGSFGDFMRDYLPRYIAADMSGALPPVPILVPSDLPPTIEQALRLAMRKGVELIPVDHFQPVRVDRLWFASNLTYAPAREVRNERYSFDHLFVSPEVMAPVVRELRRRIEPHLTVGDRRQRIYLSRGADRWRQLVNHEEIEAMAVAQGFRIAHPERLDFLAQAGLLAHASHVVAPEGSALLLCHFAAPGTKVCILMHPLAEGMNVYESIFDGIDFTLFTGPLERLDEEFPDRSDYRIDAQDFRGFLENWLSEG